MFSSSLVVPPPSAFQLWNFSIPSYSARHMIRLVCVCMFLLSVLEKLRYSRQICQQLLPSARGAAPSHSHGCSSTKPLPWQAAMDQNSDRPVRAEWPGRPPVRRMCECMHTIRPSLFWASVLFLLFLLPLPSHCLSLSIALSLPSSPSFPPSVLPSLLSSLPALLTPFFSLSLSLFLSREACRERIDCFKWLLEF